MISTIDRFVFLLLALSLAGNVYLARRAGHARGLAPRAPEAFPAVGTRVPDLVGEDAAGSPLTVGFSEAKQGTWVYVFSSACGWCERNAPNVKAALAITPVTAPRPRFVAVSLDRSDGLLHLREQDLKFDQVLQTPSRSTVRDFGLGGTPYTYLISNENVVLGVWPGAWQGEGAAAISARLGVQLPGLAPESGPAQSSGCKDAEGRSYSVGFVLNQQRCGPDREWHPYEAS